NDSISLNKYISNTGICSRREADVFIQAGRVRINGVVAVKGNRVYDNDEVLIDGQPTKKNPKNLYIAFNKPTGIITTTDLKEPKNIIKYINHPERLFPIGRLDKPSQGLIFLTNDGNIVNKILRAGNNHEKEYIVTVKQKITAKFIQKMSNGIKILGTVTKKCEVTALNDYTFKIILTQGLNRQIRRMCEHLKFDVTKLKRTRIMNVHLGKLKVGHWRLLTGAEINQIKEMVATSISTEEASLDHMKKKVIPKKKISRTPSFSKKNEPKFWERKKKRK
ncbi:UNVERIFIED_CONTAM: hypothetical protein GTU68_000464, partial [Idotea baltica]|nr:hypothetical protein [Idotea baltica]